MNSSSSRAETMKPVIVKAGVALIVSATGLILARFMTRRQDERVVPSSASNPETSSPCRSLEEEEEEEEETEHEVLRLEEEIQRKENEMEKRFQSYCNLKDKEVMLVELKGKLEMERARLDFFCREVSSMEEEQKRIQDVVIVYLRLVDKIRCLRSGKGLLRRRTKELSRIIKEKSARASGLERMLLRNLEELGMKNESANKMEDEIKEMKTTIHRLEEEKRSLQLQSRYSPEILYEETRTSLEDYERLLEEYENLKRERADEVRDMINLKCRNVWLRHTLMRYRERDQENGSRSEDTEFGGGNVTSRHHMSLEDQMALEEEHHHESEEHNKNGTSRRKRLMKRLKRWVEGDDKCKSKADERRRHSPLVVEPEEEKPSVLARRSCSSA